MRKSVLITAIVIISAFALGSLASQNGYDQFQKALAKERGEGNLEEAIALYQKVIDETKDEALAAKAQLRIGFCYEKLGRQEAQKAFEKVIENYPNQIDAVKVAREKITDLVSAEAAAPEGAGGLKLTRVYTGEDSVISISPDGKKLAFIRGSDIWTRDITGGEENRMTEGGNSNWDTAWSPDGRWITWCDTTNNLNVIEVERESSRTLITSPPDFGKSDALAVRGWTPDSKKVIYQIPSRGLFSVPLNGGESREILTFDDPKKAKTYQDMTLSPDGRLIAYMASLNGNTDIYLMTVEGRDPIRVTSNPAPDRNPMWSFDSRWIGYASYGEEMPQLWAVEISSEGKPEGRPFKVTNHDLIIGGNWMMNGSVGFSAGFRTQHIYIANPDGSEEIQLTRYARGNYRPRWSPDGKSIAFATDYRNSLNNFRAWLLPTNGGEPRLLHKTKTSPGGFVWHPDGKKLILQFGDRRVRNQTSLAEIPIREGELRELMNLEGEVECLDLSADGKFYLYSYSIRPEKYANSTEYLRERLSGISVIPIEGGEALTVLPADKKGIWYPHCEWSPDGAKIAYIVFDNARREKGEKPYSIWTMNPDGSEAKLVTEGGEYTLCWSPDGKYIVYENRIKDMDFELYRVAAAGGEPEKMNILGRSLEYSPDGKRIAYSRWIGSGYEFWIVENVLPEPGNKQR